MMRSRIMMMRSVAGVGAVSALCATPLFAQADLVIDGQRLGATWFVEDVDFPPESCALVEDCVGGPGVRRLLRFDTTTANVAQTDLVIGDPTGNPQFIWSPCHFHYHFEGFSEYQVLDAFGDLAVPGRKQAFCLLDTFAYLDEPWVSQTPRYTCDFQGLQGGWADTYSAQLDCQWVDVTNLPGGDYTLRVIVNPDAILTESDYSNNVSSVPVTLPEPSGLPPRPDGRRVPGTPLLVSHAGAQVQVDYDVTSCPAPDYNLYYGLRSDAWSYAYSGAVCGIGTSGTAVVDLPDPAPGEVIWFLLAGVDPASTPLREGGHGFDSSGRERPLSGVGLCSVQRTQSGPTCAPGPSAAAPRVGPASLPARTIERASRPSSW